MEGLPLGCRWLLPSCRETTTLSRGPLRGLGCTVSPRWVSLVRPDSKSQLHKKRLESSEDRGNVHWSPLRGQGYVPTVTVPWGVATPATHHWGEFPKKLEYGCCCLHPLRRVSSDFHHVLDALVNGQTHKWHPLHHPTYELMHEDALKGGDRDPFPHPCVLTNMTRTLPGESNPSQSQVLCISCCFHISAPPKGQLNPTQASAPNDSWPVA